MELAIKIIEIFALVTGLAYLVLEIQQKNLMWVLGILTGIACSFSFAVQHLYASTGLNIYYVAVSFWGLYQWKKDAGKLSDDAGSSIHLNKLGVRTMVISAMVLVVGSIALIALLKAIGGSETQIDAVTTVMSAIGTWWLAKSYPEQWLVWIVADLMATVLCLTAGMYWMTALYFAYTAGAVYGYVHWRRNGKIVG